VAVQWIQQVLGFAVVESLHAWATDGGPLTIGNSSGTNHLALFGRGSFTPSTAMAFGSDAKIFLEWKRILEEKGLLERGADHDLSWPLYFWDSHENSYEITTCEQEEISLAIPG